MAKRSIKRRDFLALTGAAAAGAVVAACTTAPAATPTTAPVAPTAPAAAPTTAPAAAPTVAAAKPTTGPAKVPTTFAERPAFAELFKSAKLPAVADRLPKKPMVIGGREAIGKYGGTVRMIRMDPQSFVSNYGFWTERPLQYSDADNRTIIPNILESYETKDDGKTWTFKLREGMKWSDGKPYTTDDVKFWYEDFLLNKELTPSPAWQWRWGGSVMKLEVVDKVTFTVTFAQPFGNFPGQLTRLNTAFYLPKHYMGQFHTTHQEKAKLDQMVKDAKFETWVQLFNDRNLALMPWNNVANSKEYPQLTPWIVTDQPEDRRIAVLTPNPYYWKVDEAGNQLPYFDKITSEYVVKHELVTMKIIQSELDYVNMHDVSIARYPLYKENEAKANYRVADFSAGLTDRYYLRPNFMHKDPVMAEIISNPKFVQALSVAINREEINQSLYFGLAKMGGLAPVPSSQYYSEEVGKAWAQFDKAMANKLLDEIGLNKKNAEGFRLRKDGQVVKFNIEHSGSRVGVATHEFSELVVSFWREVGIDASTKEIQESLRSQREQNGEIDCSIWHQDGGMDCLFPNGGISRFILLGRENPGWAWGWYYATGGQNGEKPPERWAKWHEQYNAMQKTSNDAERVKIGKEILADFAKAPTVIGSVLESPCPMILDKKFRNTPKKGAFVSWDTWAISDYHPAAFFYG